MYDYNNKSDEKQVKEIDPTWSQLTIPTTLKQCLMDEWTSWGRGYHWDRKVFLKEALNDG